MNETPHELSTIPEPPGGAKNPGELIVTAILRSRWHGMRSKHLLLLTFTGARVGKQYLPPLRYTQEGETLQVIVV